MLREEAGRDLVYVLDGHVYVFEARAGEVARVRTPQTPVAPLTAAPSSPPIDVRGCRADGPCIARPAGDPQPGYFAWDGTGPTEVCVTGTGFGDAPGELLLHGAPVATTRWGDGEICLTLDVTAIDDGLVQVRDAAGVPSNRLGFITPPRNVTITAPDAVALGDAVVVEGDNLGHGTYRNGGPMILGGGGGRIALTAPFAHAEAAFSYLKLGHTYASVTRAVPPRLVVGCVATANTPCEVGGLSLGKERPQDIASAGYSATVGGMAAPLTILEPTRLRVEWPAGLADGVHPLVFTRPDGLTATVDVEKTGEPALIRLGSDAPDGLYLDLANPRAAVVGDRVWVERFAHEIGRDDAGLPTPGDLSRLLTRYDLGAMAGLEPLEAPDDDAIVLDDPAIPTEKDRVGLGARLVVLGDARFLAEPAGVWAVNADDETLQRPRLVQLLPNVDAGWLADARVVDGRLVTAHTTFIGGDTTVTVLEASGDDLVKAGGGAFAGGPGLGVGKNLHSPGTTLTDAGIYTAPSRNNGGETQVVTFRAFDKAASPWTLGPPSEVWSGSERILAASADGDGFVFVIGAGAGATVLRHAPTTGLSTLAEAPATLPGLAEALPELGGAPIEDVGVSADGVLVLLLADRSQQPQRLRVARWDGAAWQLGAPFGDRMAQERGEDCVGPQVIAADCPDRGRYGCVPVACPLAPLTYRRRARVRIGEAALTVDGDQALVTYQVQHLDANPAGYPWGLHEAYLVATPLP